MAEPRSATLDKALSLWTSLAADGGARPLSSISREVGVPLSTAHRIVAAFERRGFLTRASRGHYVPGPVLLQLAGPSGFRQVLTAAGRPVIAELGKKTGLTAHLGILEGDMVTYLIKARDKGPELFTREGMQLEAYCSGIGKILLAALPEEDLDRYLASGPFVSLTPNTIVEPYALRHELSQVRERGYAVDDAEVDLNLRCLAVPVRDGRDDVIAAISLSSHRPSGSPGEVQSLLDGMRAAAIALEQRLFGRAS
jgi:IclR family acetate operon transcriptional repressor